MIGFNATAIQAMELVILTICFAEMTKVSSVQSAITSGLNVTEVYNKQKFDKQKSKANNSIFCNNVCSQVQRRRRSSVITIVGMNNF